jgi:protein TonB
LIFPLDESRECFLTEKTFCPMNRDDWIGLGASAGVHLALVLLFAGWTAGPPAAPTLGALQLEVGAFAEGRPVQQSEHPTDEPASSEDAPTDPEQPDEAAQQPSDPPSEQKQPEQQQSSAPKQSAPVDLPEQKETAGDEPPPEEPPEETQQDAPPAPETNDGPAEEKAPAEANASENDAGEETPEQSAPADAASEDGEQTGEATGNASGEPGSGSDEERASPFDIEGLDRTLLYGPEPPEPTLQDESTVKVKVTVNPQGRVVALRLTQKANNPSLERSVMEALREWRFNRLPSGAPQKTQTGVVTFRFRLE